MATSRCVGFALPVQTGLRRKTELQGRRASEQVVLKLGLGQHGSCGCQAATNKYDPGYKKSVPKRSDSKKAEKYGSVAEASSSGRQTKKVSKKDQVRFAIEDEDDGVGSSHDPISVPSPGRWSPSETPLQPSHTNEGFLFWLDIFRFQHSLGSSYKCTGKSASAITRQSGILLLASDLQISTFFRVWLQAHKKLAFRHHTSDSSGILVLV